MVHQCLELRCLDLRHSKERGLTLGILKESRRPEAGCLRMPLMEEILLRPRDDIDARAVCPAHVRLADLVHVHRVIGIRRFLRIQLHAGRYRQDRPHRRTRRLAVVLLVRAGNHEMIQLRGAPIRDGHVLGKWQPPQAFDHKILSQRQREAAKDKRCGKREWK